MRREGTQEYTTDSYSTAPERTLTQRLDALQRANQVRTARAQLKRDLKGGRSSIHTLLLDPPACIETAKVFDMLLAVPTYGRVKVNKVLTQCRISPSKTIGGLSQRQRDELVLLLRREPAPQRAVASPPRSVPTAAVRSDLELELADEELARGLEQLLEEARHVGRLAGQAAQDAGEDLDASAPRPDTVGLQAALRQTLGEGARLTVCVTVTDDAALHMTTRDVAPALDMPRGMDEMDALRHANEMRLARGHLKRKIGDGTVTVSEVILTCPWEAASMTLAALLTSQRRWGPTRCTKFLASIGLPETKTIGSMTERQRRALAAMLG